MKGFTKSVLAMLSLAGCFSSLGCWGGEHYRNLVDPCPFERYGAMARQSVITSFTPQVQNGRILDQTIFNYHFEAGPDKVGTAKLHPMGIQKLTELVQRRPEPDCRIFLATARDINYNPGDPPEAFADARRKLDEERREAILKYLASQTWGRGIVFEVLVHDPAEPGMAGVAARNISLTHRGGYTGVGPNSTGSGGGAGAVGGGGGGGGGAGVGVGGAPGGPGGTMGGGTPGGTGSGTGSNSGQPPR